MNFLMTKNSIKSIRCLLSISFLLLYSLCNGQNYSNRQFSINALTTAGIKIETTPEINKFGKKSNMKGSCYLDKEWLRADIFMAWDSVIYKDVQTRIDLRRNEVEVKTNDKIGIIPSFRVHSVFFPDSKTLLITEYPLKSEKKGFYKVLVDGNNALLCKYEIEIKPSNYNIALQVGNKNDTMIKVKNYYLYRDGELIAIGKSKGKLKKQFQSNDEAMKFISTNKINPKNEESLMKFFEFANQENLSLK